MSYEFIPGTPGVHDMGIFQPFLDSLATEEEQISSGLLVLNLLNLNSYVNDYAAAVALHTYIAEMRGVIDQTLAGDNQSRNAQHHIVKIWNEMAGRDAAMIIFHIGKALHAVRTSLDKTPTIKSGMVDGMLTKARRTLEREFQNYEVARDAAGHRAEAGASEATILKHAVEIDGGRRFIPGRIDGDDYVATFKKKELRVSLSGDARLKLARIVSDAYAAFPQFAGMLPPLKLGS